MTPDIACAQCGEPIERDYQIDNPAEREPCPKCGSTSRAYSESGTVTFSMHTSGAEEVVTYPRILLNNANRLLLDGQVSIAVIVAHMACEVAVERRLAEAFDKQRISHLQDAIYDFLNGFNLGNEKLRKLYTALTGDQIQVQPFWERFLQSVRRRNMVIHKGKLVTEAEAEDSLRVTEALIKHLGM